MLNPLNYVSVVMKCKVSMARTLHCTLIGCPCPPGPWPKRPEWEGRDILGGREARGRYACSRSLGGLVDYVRERALKVRTTAPSTRAPREVHVWRRTAGEWFPSRCLDPGRAVAKATALQWHWRTGLANSGQPPALVVVSYTWRLGPRTQGPRLCFTRTAIVGELVGPAGPW